MADLLRKLTQHTLPMHSIINPLPIVLYDSIVGYGSENTLAVPLAEFVLAFVVGGGLMEN